MRFGALRAWTVSVAAALALSGCADSVSSATPTPVDFKACLISSPAGFADSGSNAQARYGLMQSMAEFGESISTVELKVGDSATAVRKAARRLISRGCKLILGVGANSASALIPLANGNPSIRFAVVGYEGQAGGGDLAGSNLDAISFDSKLAMMQAGYLAAAKSSSAVVSVIAQAGALGVREQAWYFRQGVEIYNTDLGATVRVFNLEGSTPASWRYVPAGASSAAVAKLTQASIDEGADVFMPLGVDGSDVASLVAGSKKFVIGTDSDWAAEPAYASERSAVLASITKPVSHAVIDEVQRAMGGATRAATAPAAGEPQAYLYESVITPEAGVTWGAGVAASITKLAQEYADGSLKFTSYGK